MHYNPDDLMDLALKVAKPLENYLILKQVVDRKDRGKNTVLGLIINRLRKEGSLKSFEALKLAAYADAEYQAYLKDYARDEKAMIAAQVEYENLSNQFKALQSALAFERDAMKRNI